jgi:hypothetical protein
MSIRQLPSKRSLRFYDEKAFNPAQKVGMNTRADALVLESTITCPVCGQQATEAMPTNACIFFYDCAGCGAQLRPKPGDCCVFCSYGTVPCPPIQQQKSCCNEH